MGIALFIGQSKIDRYLQIGVGLIIRISPTLFHFIAMDRHHLQQIVFIEMKIGINRFVFGNRGQFGRFAFANQIADIDQVTADTSADWRNNPGIVQLQFSLLNLSLRSFDTGFCRIPIRFCVDHFSFCDRTFPARFFKPPVDTLGFIIGRIRLCQPTFGQRHFRLIRPGIDHE